MVSAAGKYACEIDIFTFYSPGPSTALITDGYVDKEQLFSCDMQSELA